jgi:hypothetical protein
MTAKISGDSGPGVSINIFLTIQDSFTTQGLLRNPGYRLAAAEPKPGLGVRIFWRSNSMPYALFCNEARLSKAYPTEADVWKLARHSGLVVDVVSEEEKPHPRPVLDNDYEIRPCQADPQENPEKNRVEFERDHQLEFQLDS